LTDEDFSDSVFFKWFASNLRFGVVSALTDFKSLSVLKVLENEAEEVRQRSRWISD
jgi:hypothetical protein